MDNSKSSKQILLTTVGVAILVVALVGITYAFFNYTRTGAANTISTGQINFLTTQSNTLSLTNVFPMASSEVTNANLDEVEIRIQGDTTYSGGEEFEITIEGLTNTIGTSPNEKTIPINFIATYVPTASGENIGSEAVSDYYSERGSTTTVYELTESGIATNGKQILVGYIPANGEIDGTLKVSAYIDSSNIAISDTYYENVTTTPTPSAPNDEYGTTTEWVNDRTVLTTAEWNALQNAQVPLSFKIKAVSQEGTWVENPNTLYNMMKRSSQGTISSFAQASDQDGTSGVYQTIEGTTPIYYYRGNVDNNVIFGDYCWKIIRTTITGGLKLIYNGEAANNKCETQTGYGTMIYDTSGIKFNNNAYDEQYAGYTYDEGGVETDSNIKSVIDTWYSGAVTNNKIDDSKVEMTTYCNDRSSRTSGSYIYYGAYDRLTPSGSYSDVTPILNCPNSSDNYSLKVGLITADEVVYAGGKIGVDNRTYYLNNTAYQSTSMTYWTGSPYYFYWGYAFVFYVAGSGFVRNSNVSGTDVKGVRPVISLVPGKAITGGNGTPTQPYIVS